VCGNPRQAAVSRAVGGSEPRRDKLAQNPRRVIGNEMQAMSGQSCRTTAEGLLQCRHLRSVATGFLPPGSDPCFGADDFRLPHQTALTSIFYSA